MSRAVQLVMLSVVILTCLQIGVANDEVAAHDHITVDIAFLQNLLLLTKENLRRDLTSLINKKVASLVSELDLVKSNVKNTMKSQLKEHKKQTASQLTGLQSHVTSELTGVQSHVTSELAELQSNVNDSMNRISDNVEAHDNHLTTELMELDQNLQQNFTLQLENSYGFFTQCGGTLGWRRVVYMNFTDPNTPCPSGWRLTSHSKRTCGRVSTGTSCDSVTFPVSKGNYTRVCGRIIAYQNRSTYAFSPYHGGRVTTINGPYVDGVSLTHGSRRQHIWTFAAGFSEVHDRNYDVTCPCDATRNIRIPPFVGGDYFCESGHNSGPRNLIFRTFFSNDPLWDGDGCTADSTCCSFNNPPYFTKQLPSPTTDDIEARICHESSLSDTPIELIELYVM